MPPHHFLSSERVAKPRRPVRVFSTEPQQKNEPFLIKNLSAGQIKKKNRSFFAGVGRRRRPGGGSELVSSNQTFAIK